MAGRNRGGEMYFGIGPRPRPPLRWSVLLEQTKYPAGGQFQLRSDVGQYRDGKPQKAPSRSTLLSWMTALFESEALSATLCRELFFRGGLEASF